MRLQRIYLFLAFFMVAGIALLYGLCPEYFAGHFLGVDPLDVSFKHILRAMMGLYLAFGFYWLWSAFDASRAMTGLVTILIFDGGLLAGRLLSLAVDGMPAPLLQFYTALEVGIFVVTFGVWRMGKRGV
ncbi:MAG: DUF4345 domain-containing protein [Solimonas sp.]